MRAVSLRGVLRARPDVAKGAKGMLFSWAVGLPGGASCAYLATHPEQVGYRAEDWPDWAKIGFFGFGALFFLAGVPFALYFWLTVTGRLATLYMFRIGSGARIGSPLAIVLGRSLRIPSGSMIAVRTEKLKSVDMPGTTDRFRWHVSNGTDSTRAFIVYGMPEADLERFTEALAAEGVSVSFPS